MKTREANQMNIFGETEVIPPKTGTGVKSPPAAPSKPAKKKPAPKAKPKPAASTAVAKVEPAPKLPAAPAAPVNMLMVIANAAADPRVDTEKMRALLDMQKELMREEARIAAIQSFNEMQGELPVIGMDGRIVIDGKSGKRGQSTPYATYANICDTVKPVLARHGWSLWDEPDMADDGRVVMVVHLDHVRGEQRKARVSLPMETSGSKNNVQGVGSSLSYARRYGAIMLLNLTSRAKEDQDFDGAPPPIDGDGPEAFIDASQLKALNAAIEECKVGVQRFCEHYAIDKLESLPAGRYTEAMRACAEYKAKTLERGNG